MKTFYAAIIFFFILLILIGVNYAYINARSDELEKLTVELPSPESDGCSDSLEKIESLWKKNERIFSFSIVRSEINSVSEAIISLRVYCDKKDSVEFERHKLLLLDAIDEIRRLEAFKIESVL